ncbi:MAG TPA: peptidoglycan recognition family protein [Blastocatellia bacterium]|nr:peptidoglycan recognition family protein [Blastocatellia bacterium]
MQDFNPQNLKYAKLVDRYSRYIESPVLRLKFLQNALKSEPPSGRLARLPFIGTLKERAMVVAEVSKVLPLNQPAPLALRLTALVYRMRYAVYAASVALALIVGASLVYTGAKVINSFSVSTQAKNATAQTGQQQAVAADQGDVVRAIASEAALPLEKIWLAEQGEGYEFYSNGARVLTEFQTDGAKRSFYRFDLESLANNSGKGELLNRPVGIIYHISESDMLPFDDSYNSSLQNHSRALLEYARAHRLYNYVIDRFGRVYRIVRDEEAANHAGNSVWSDGKSLYVNLSASFIGICFEGKSGADKTIGPDRINEAQIYAARVLTAVLRSKYAIDDANCVTHGLVSVNPSNRLMGYHTDWIAGFPFEAIGLSNKYNAEMTAVSRLGFSYDRAYVAAAGGKAWPGLERADAMLREAAKKNNLSIEQQRRAMAKIFDRAYFEQRELEHDE